MPDLQAFAVHVPAGPEGLDDACNAVVQRRKRCVLHERDAQRAAIGFGGRPPRRQVRVEQDAGGQGDQQKAESEALERADKGNRCH